MEGQLVATAILLPFIVAAIVFFVPVASLRRALVISLGVILAIVAVILAGYESLQVSLPEIAGLDWSMTLGVLDLALVVTILYFAWRSGHRLAFGLAAIQLLVVLYLEFGMGHHASEHATFWLDRLSTTLGLIVSIVGSIICVYALRYMDEHEEHHHISASRQGRFFFFLVAFLGAMNGLVFANDLGWLFFFWEMTTLCSFMLIGHDGTPIARANAARALWMNLLGGIGFGAGLIILNSSGREASLQALLAGGEAAPLAALSLLLFAAFTKSAQMPFQSWLLGAMVAPTPVSALLHSAAMVKAGVYLIVRLAPAYQGTTLSLAVAAVGAFTFVVTAILALTPQDSKRVLAYSTISNLGLIVACAGINTSLSLAAAVMLIIFHAVSKAMLFLSVGAIEHAIGSREIDAMEGLVQRHKKLGMIAALGIISMALPPAGMLLAKWIAIEAGVIAMPILTILFAVGSGATVAFWARWLGRLFTTVPGHKADEVSLGTIYSATLYPLAVMVVVLGVGAGYIVDRFLEPGMSQYYAASAVGVGSTALAVSAGMSSFPLGWLYALVLVALGLPLLSVALKPSQVRPAYMCGENMDGVENQAFLTIGETREVSSVTSYNFNAFFAEDKVVRIGNIVAIVLIVIAIGGGFSAAGL